MAQRIVSLLPARLEARVSESWTRLVSREAGRRGLTPVGSVGMGELLWREWSMFVDDELYDTEITRRQEALRKLQHHDIPARERDDAMALLSAAMPPHLFRKQVLDPVLSDGWTILVQAQAQYSPPDEIPEFLANAVEEANRTWTAEEQR